VSSGGDKTVFLWDVATATTLRRFSGHNGRVECVVFAGESDGVIVSGSYDASVRIWDTRSQTGKPLMSLNEAKDSVTSLAVVDAEIVAGSVDGRVRTYDLRMGGCYVDVIGRKSEDWQNMMSIKC
jgi:mitogen-activated protein kinase organizer 1